MTMGFPGGPVVKKTPAMQEMQETWEADPWVGKTPGGGHGNQPQYSHWESTMDRGAWWAAVYGVAELDMTIATAHLQPDLRQRDASAQSLEKEMLLSSSNST